MIVLYTPDGFIHTAIYGSDWFAYSSTDGYSLYEIDEVDPVNKELCYELARITRYRDAEGDGKYKIIDGVLQEKEGWVAEVEDVL
jgi:hypothetical protein